MKPLHIDTSLLGDASARSGLCAEGSPYATTDFHENYLRAVFAFLGVSDVQVSVRRA